MTQEELRKLYIAVCESGDSEATVGRIGDARLACLIQWLDERGVGSGVPALVLGMLEREAVVRFTLENRQNFSPVGEG